MFIVYFAGGFQVFAIGTYGVTSLDVFTLLFYCLFFFKAIWHNTEFKIPAGLLTGAFALFSVSLFTSAIPLYASLPAAEIAQYFKTLSHLLFMMLFAGLCLSYEFKTSLVDKVLKTWLILSIIINIFGIYQIFARAFDLPLAWLDYNNISMSRRGTADEQESIKQLSLQYGNFFRATSIFSEPSALATFNIYILILIVIPYIQKTKMFFKSNLLNILIFIFAVAGLFLAFSLTGVLGLILILGGVFVLESIKIKRRILTIAAVMFALLIPADLLIEQFTDTSVLQLFTKRITGIVNMNNKMAEGTEGESFGSRLLTVNKSIQVWEQSPLFGTGLGLTQFNKEVDMDYPDFSIMNALCELGIVGALGFGFMFVALLIIGWKANNYIKKNPAIDDSLKRHFGLIFYLTLVQVEINFFTGNNLVVPNLWVPIFFILVPAYKFMLMHNKTYSFRLFNHALKDKLEDNANNNTPNPISD